MLRYRHLSRRGGTVAILLFWVLALGCGDRSGSAPAVAADSTLLGRITRPAENGQVHLVRIVGRAPDYAFEPAEIRIEQGDVVRFVHTGYQPESVAFLWRQSSPAAAEFLQTAGVTDGILLTSPGQIYDVDFDGAPPGLYQFMSTTHPAMTGVVEVVED
ncbi:MAG TPA: plastocyanin/azurin family copper-binding protein [Longimicrobiaceae bacterium]|nr:plastocyanin/azurin family copper-binding protein [Longimicrobiaceae bacterium]